MSNLTLQKHLSKICLQIYFFFQTREQFHASRDDIHALMRKMLEVRQSVRVL